MCIACVSASFFGGIASSAVGIRVPNQEGASLLSTTLTCNLMVITTVALKHFFNLSICQGRSINIKTLAILTAFNLPLSMVYSIGVNYLLNCFIYTSPKKSARTSCCSQNQQL